MLWFCLGLWALVGRWSCWYAKPRMSTCPVDILWMSWHFHNPFMLGLAHSHWCSGCNWMPTNKMWHLGMVAIRNETVWHHATCQFGTTVCIAIQAHFLPCCGLPCDMLSWHPLNELTWPPSICAMISSFTLVSGCNPMPHNNKKI